MGARDAQELAKQLGFLKEVLALALRKWLDEGLVRDQRRVDQRRVNPPQQVGIECAVARSPDA